MKIKLFSDLHLEFRNNLFDHIHEPHKDDKDTTLLLAGDIALSTQSIPFIEEMCKHFKHVLMICGNHEFYHHQFNKVIDDFAAWELEGAPENYHFLHNDLRILDGVRFLGGTMWTDFDHSNPLVLATAQNNMNDYNIIYGSDGTSITPHFVLRENEKFIDFLIQKFAEPFDGKTVVMSHHSPGNALRRSSYSKPGLLDACYYADMEQYVGNEDKAVLWVHGHVHQSYDYMINNTRVVTNPYGYWGRETNPDFDPHLVVEI